jgi:hypothetical protein
MVNQPQFSLEKMRFHILWLDKLEPVDHCQAKQPFPFSKRDIEAPPAPEKDSSLQALQPTWITWINFQKSVASMSLNGDNMRQAVQANSRSCFHLPGYELAQLLLSRSRRALSTRSSKG